MNRYLKESSALVKKGSIIKCGNCQDPVLEAIKDIAPYAIMQASDVRGLQKMEWPNGSRVRCLKCGWDGSLRNYFLDSANWKLPEVGEEVDKNQLPFPHDLSQPD